MFPTALMKINRCGRKLKVKESSDNYVEIAFSHSIFSLIKNLEFYVICRQEKAQQNPRIKLDISICCA